jgi:hypothetical protein
MNNLDEIYKQKYLKYKAKYLELKEQQGGIIYNTGQYVFFYKPNNLNNKLSNLVDDSRRVLKTSFNIFTDNLANNAYYYKIDKKPTNNFKILRNLTSPEVAVTMAKKKMADAAYAIVKSSCKQVEPYYKCGDIENTNPYEIIIDNSNYIGLKDTEQNFKDKAGLIIEQIKKKEKWDVCVAVLLDVGTFSTKIIFTTLTS